MKSEALSYVSVASAVRGNSSGNQAVSVLSTVSFVFSVGLFALSINSSSFANLAVVLLGVFGGGLQLIGNLTLYWVYSSKCLRLGLRAERMVMAFWLGGPLLTATAAALAYTLPGSGGFGIC